MKITYAEFVKSSSHYKDCPQEDKPEYAFIGRSNVGKSSLINRLTNKRSLAKTSQTPGKTQLINHFLINNAWFLVDLPGYGWAKPGAAKREGFGKMIQNYILQRKELTNLFVLLDCRLEPQAIDISFLSFLGEKQLPFAICFTKADKISKNVLYNNINQYKSTLLQSWAELPPIFITSSDDGRGCVELLAYIASTNALVAEAKNPSTSSPQNSNQTIIAQQTILNDLEND